MSGDTLINLTDVQKKARVAESEEIIIKANVELDLAAALNVLKGTDEFKLVFESGYFDLYAQNVFKEMTNPPQFAKLPLEDCEDTLAGIKALKAYIGFESNLGIVELEARQAELRKVAAERVLDAIGM